MNKKTALDIAIFISCLTGMILSYVYLENDTEQKMSLLIFGIIGICFMVLAVMDKNRPEGKNQYCGSRKGISRILLLGEEGNITAAWDIYGKTSVVFGRDERENQVDVNLRNTDYEGPIDVDHAVMNYCDGNWYI